MAPFLCSPVVAALRRYVTERPKQGGGLFYGEVSENGKPRRAASIRTLRGGPSPEETVANNQKAERSGHF